VQAGPFLKTSLQQNGGSFAVDLQICLNPVSVLGAKPGISLSIVTSWQALWISM
jgi:hypothetical protein